MERRFGRGSKGKRYFMFPLVAIAFAAAGGLAVMLLWNNIIPAVIPGVSSLSYLQAIGLLVLCRILVGGFKGRPGGFRPGHEGWRPGPGWREKMNNMTEEERTKFREEWKERCRKRAR